MNLPADVYDELLVWLDEQAHNGEPSIDFDAKGQA